MPLFSVKTSKKIDTNIRLEESTAKMLDRYAHFHQGPADDVVNEALEYIFTKDKDFQQYLRSQPEAEVPSSYASRRFRPALRLPSKLAGTGRLRMAPDLNSSSENEQPFRSSPGVPVLPAQVRATTAPTSTAATTATANAMCCAHEKR